MKLVDDRVFEVCVGAEPETVTTEVRVKTCPSDDSTMKETVEEEVSRDREEVVDEVVEEVVVMELVAELLEGVVEEVALTAELELGVEDVAGVVEVVIEEEEGDVDVVLKVAGVDVVIGLDSGGFGLAGGICVDMVSDYGGNECDARERQLNDRWKSESEMEPS